jgi:hypothetical protein
MFGLVDGDLQNHRDFPAGQVLGVTIMPVGVRKLPGQHLIDMLPLQLTSAARYGGSASHPANASDPHGTRTAESHGIL